MIELIAFPSSYSDDSDGLKQALVDSKAEIVNVDTGDCSYSIMYSVSAMKSTMEKLTNTSFNMGIYDSESNISEVVYYSISELDNLVSDDKIEAWDDLCSAFRKAEKYYLEK